MLLPSCDKGAVLCTFSPPVGRLNVLGELVKPWWLASFVTELQALQSVPPLALLVGPLGSPSPCPSLISTRSVPMLFVLDTTPRHERGPCVAADHEDLGTFHDAGVETISPAVVLPKPYFVDEPLVDDQPCHFGLVRESFLKISFMLSIIDFIFLPLHPSQSSGRHLRLSFDTPFSAHQDTNQFPDLQELTLHIPHFRQDVI